MKRFFLFFIFIVFIPAVNADDSFQALFAKANKHFEAGDIKAAAELYQSIYTQGCNDKNVFYNLGNCMLKMGKVGQAIYFYRKALKIDPRDGDVLANLKIARSSVPSRVEPEVKSMRSSIVQMISSHYTSGEMASVFVIFYLLTCTSVTWAVLLTHRKSRRKLMRIAYCLIFLLILMGAGLGSYIYDHQIREYAVAIDIDVIARNGPGEHFNEVFVQQPGYEMMVKRHRAGWAEIVLSNGYTGWVPEHSIQII